VYICYYENIQVFVDKKIGDFVSRIFERFLLSGKTQI
jgi:hypothetical protein